MTVLDDPSSAPLVGFGLADPLLRELDLEIEQIDGALPRELSGTLYRIGPGKLQVGATMLDNILDGDGMVSRFTLDGGRAHFRNRYVRTPQFRHGQRSSRIVHRGLGTMRPGGRLANLLRMPTNVANTGVVRHGGELLALWELGRPHRLDLDTLETLGTEDFGGTLKWIGAFSAHPKTDPRTGEMFNFGLDLLPRPQIRCYRTDRAGRTRQVARVPLLDLPWNHDMALTDTHLVFVLDPILPDIRKLVLSSCSYLEALSYRPRRGTRFLLVPRAGGRPRIVEHEALLHFHLGNAFDDGGDVVVDLVHFGPDWHRVTRALGHIREHETLPDSRLMRYRITPGGRVVEQELLAVPSEFPQLDPRRTGRSNRFGYLAGRVEGPHYDAIMKIDNGSGRSTAHRMPGHSFGEALFVPRSGDTAEDDGWLLAMAIDQRERRTKLVVLDARDLEREPMAVLHLPFTVPLGFHGLFTRRVAATAGRGAAASVSEAGGG
ncbi:carotenoid oxygenase family protein [Pseudonocardia sp. GCM10023141]|uniref:carotenoid oxygenase family protein n=1 Tax=Pseudonocardia sp. GCM10023141 TaxID=3252653 RepID=UPI0036198370